MNIRTFDPAEVFSSITFVLENPCIVCGSSRTAIRNAHGKKNRNI
jgi:hypothetical protein